MNVGGHVTVATAVLQGRGPGFLLGAALPDLAAMGRFRLRGHTTDQAVTAGIAVHHATDDAFHRHPWFVERNRRLAGMLLDAGVDRGAARACSHVGIELLLDGELLADRAIAEAIGSAFDAIVERRHALATLVVADDRLDWLTHLDWLATHHLPSDYDDAVAVARRLYRILARRPRLALNIDHVEIVAETLTDAQPDIKATARSLVDDLEAAMVDAS